MPIDMNKKQQINIWYALAAFGLLVLFQFFYAQSQQIEQVPYSEFVTMLNKGQIESVEVRDQIITGKLKTPTADGRQYFATARVEPDIAAELEKSGVKFRGVVESNFLTNLLSWIVPVVFFFGLWAFFIRRFAEKQGLGGMMTVGKSKAKVYVEKDTKVTFGDVAGQDEAKAELQEIVNFLKSPDEYGRLGARLPKGILLVGPPGTGKTLFARAVAGEAGVPFFSISGSEFVEMFVGVGAARVRDLFEQARKAAPCIIFIDELDALGRSRAASGPYGGHDEKEQTLNQLLAELDGFDTSSGIVLLAATNRPEILDPALLRAGRFDRQVLVDRPDKLGRIAILKVHVRKIKLAQDVDLEQVAALTPGFTGADLANLVNEAAIVATRNRRSDVTLDDFNIAIERIVAGIEKRGRLLGKKERKVVAYHEMGHALVASALPGMDPVHKVSIIPRGIGALGYTIQRPTEDRFLISTDDLKNKMAVLMGGRAAEQLIFNEISTGAADDLEKVTGIARDMVARYGMARESVGQVVYEERPHVFLGDGGVRQTRGDYSEETAREIDIAVRKLIEDAFARALETLTRRLKDLDAGAALLLEKETLTSDEFPALAPTKYGQAPGS